MANCGGLDPTGAGERALTISLCLTYIQSPGAQLGKRTRVDENKHDIKTARSRSACHFEVPPERPGVVDRVVAIESRVWGIATTRACIVKRCIHCIFQPAKMGLSAVK